MALDREEMESYRFWILSGRDPKKFPWSSPDHAGTSPGVSAETMIGLAGRIAKRNPAQMKKRDAWEYAKSTGQTLVFKMAMCDVDTGKFIKYVYVDEDGREVNTEGYATIEMRSQEAQAHAQKVVSAIALKSKAEG